MYQLHKSSKQDIEKIASCQLACFENSFSTKLGLLYTAKSLNWFLAGENRFLFHVEDGEKAVGFCGGFISQRPGDGSTSGLMQYAMREAAIGMIRKPGLFFSKELQAFYPLIFKNIYRKINPGKKTNNAVNKYTNEEKKAGLVVIGVHPQFRGKGVFDMLMHAFEEESKNRKISKMALSVKPTNARAIAAYQKAGWQKEKETDTSVDMYKIVV